MKKRLSFLDCVNIIYIYPEKNMYGESQERS